MTEWYWWYKSSDAGHNYSQLMTMEEVEERLDGGHPVSYAKIGSHIYFGWHHQSIVNTLLNEGRDYQELMSLPSYYGWISRKNGKVYPVSGSHYMGEQDEGPLYGIILELQRLLGDGLDKEAISLPQVINVPAQEIDPTHTDYHPISYYPGANIVMLGVRGNFHDDLHDWAQAHDYPWEWEAEGGYMTPDGKIEMFKPEFTPLVEEAIGQSRLDKEALSLPQSLAPAAVGLSLLGPMVNPPAAEALPATPQVQQIQQAPQTQETQEQTQAVTKDTITKALSAQAGKPITFTTANLYKNGWNGYADWEKNLVSIDYRLANKLYRLPAIDPDPVEGTIPAFATLAHELGHVMSGSNLSEYAATRWGCNHLDGLATKIGMKGAAKQKLVAAAWKELNEGEGCRNRRDLNKSGAHEFNNPALRKQIEEGRVKAFDLYDREEVLNKLQNYYSVGFGIVGNEIFYGITHPDIATKLMEYGYDWETLADAIWGYATGEKRLYSGVKDVNVWIDSGNFGKAPVKSSDAKEMILRDLGL